MNKSTKHPITKFNSSSDDSDTGSEINPFSDEDSSSDDGIQAEELEETVIVLIPIKIKRPKHKKKAIRPRLKNKANKKGSKKVNRKSK